MKRWVSVSVVCLISGVVWAERPDLTGMVVTSDESALEGTTVYIWTASVKEGTSPFCPSCYADCGKKSVTDEEGRFTIPSLDPTLRFKVLAVKEGYLPTFADKVDPAEGETMIVLGEIPEDRLAPDHSVVGRVVDAEGWPVVGAIIEPFGRKTARGARYGTMPNAGVDPLAVTNDQGEFVLTSDVTNATFYAHVYARNFATKNVHTLTTGGDDHVVTMDRGVTVTGQVRDNGTGFKGVEMGMVQTDRGAHTFLGDYSVGVFDSGFFELPNMPADLDYSIYGIMASLQGKGAIPVRTIRTGANGEQMEVEPFDIVRGVSISGQVVLSDGAAIPPKTRLLIWRDDAPDSLFCELDEAGRFSASYLPPGPYELHIRVDGYRLSEKNYSLDPDQKSYMLGLFTSNNDDLTILLEPGRPNPTNTRAMDVGSGLHSREEIERWQKLQSQIRRVFERRKKLRNEEIRGWEKE